MKQPLIIPSLADLRQDIAGSIPVDLIKAWIESDRSDATHAKLLEPYIKKGILVKSDSSGLSKLSRARPLIEVLKLVSDPKELVAAHGQAIGGVPVGIWIADDTQMFYPESVSAEAVLRAMTAVQAQNASSAVQIGLCIGHGTFLHIGDGMYGPDAELVEQLAEDHTEGGEIACTDSFVRCLPDHLATRMRPKEGSASSSAIFRFDYAGMPSAPVVNTHVDYPAPFSKTFLHELDAYQPGSEEHFVERYGTESTVVLLRIFHAPQPLLLDELSAYVAANSEMARLATTYDVTKIKTNGELGIYTCASNDEALHFAQAAREHASTQGWTVNLAAVRGTCFVFPMDNGEREIAGSPVNIASKLAEDTDERNVILIEASAAHGVTHPSSAQPFSVTRSGVTLSGVRL